MRYNARMKNVTAYIHTHWDREWYREFEEFRLRLIEVADDLIQKLQRIPVFYFDGQTSAIEDYLEIRPEKKDEILSLINRKKLFIGPFYCSADEFLVSAESLIRNLSLGIRKSEEFGCDDFIAYLSDTFGHSRFMPAILKCAGIDKAILWRGLNSSKADLNWYGIKTLYLAQGYFQDFLHGKTNADGLKRYIDKISEKSGENLLLAVGGDHLGIPDNLNNKISELNKIYKNEYEIKIGSPFDYFKKIKERTEIKGEFLSNDENFILQGVYSSRTDIKQKNHLAQNLLGIAETFGAVNSFFSYKNSYQKFIDYAYKILIKNHAHDSIYGCSTDTVNREVLTRYDKVCQIGEGIINRCIRDISDNSNKISIINLSDEDFEGVVKIKTTEKLPSCLKAVKINSQKGFSDKILYNTQQVPITEDYTNVYEYLIYAGKIQKFSQKTVGEEVLRNDIKTTKNTIENKFIKVEISNGKINVTDKIQNRNYKDFIGIKDVADIGDSYNFGALKDDKPILGEIKSFKISDTKFLAEMKVKAEIKIPQNSIRKGRSKKTYSHLICLNIVLKTNSKTADVKILNNNKSKNHKLSTFIKMPQAVERTFSDDLAGIIERHFDKDFDINRQIPAPRGKEIKTNTMPIQNFVFTQGIGVVTKGLKEVEIDGNNLCITLIRSTGVISNPHNPTRGTPAGPPIETPDLQMYGEHSFEFSLTFTDKAENLYKISTNLNNPPVAYFGNSENRTFLGKDNDNIKIIAVKESSDGIVLHTVNTSVKEEFTEINAEKGEIYLSDIHEQTLTKCKKIKYQPNEVKILKIK